MLDTLVSTGHFEPGRPRAEISGVARTFRGRRFLNDVDGKPVIYGYFEDITRWISSEQRLAEVSVDRSARPSEPVANSVKSATSSFDVIAIRPTHHVIGAKTYPDTKRSKPATPGDPETILAFPTKVFA